jgi:hypothetical protein
MLHLLRLSLVLMALGASPLLAADGPPPQSAAVQAFLTKVSAGEKGITTVRIPFVQEKHLAIMDDTLTSNGVIEINRTLGAVRWEFTGKSLMIFGHGKIRRWDAQGKQESVPNDPNLKPFQDQMQAFVTGDWTPLEQAFTLTPDPAGGAVLTLTPRSPQLAKYLSQIEMHFRDDFTAPKQLRMVASGGDETIYKFSDPQIGVDLPAARFEKP